MDMPCSYTYVCSMCTKQPRTENPLIDVLMAMYTATAGNTTSLTTTAGVTTPPRNTDKSTPTPSEPPVSSANDDNIHIDGK